MRAGGERIVGEDVFRDDEEIEAAHRIAHGIGAGQRHGRIGRHHPERLEPAVGDGVHHRDGLEALGLRHARRLPKAADAVDLGRRIAHMGGEHVGEAADLAPAHGVGLAGQRERAAAWLADAAGGQMAMQDRRDLVGALRRLVDALAPGGDDGRGFRPKRVEARDLGLRQAGPGGGGGDIRRDRAGVGERGVQAGDVALDIGAVDEAAIGQMDEQAGEERAV